MALIQKGFLNNNIELIKEGNKLVKDGNNLFIEKSSISQYRQKIKSIYQILLKILQKNYFKCS
ncbi:hypothetical protein AFAEC_0261 [Aliarcobacter faecis]|uniref:hypothetical protein n=1 Tax=Aliarcobacter faecis TaxID=1564138 RepID=UPI000489E0EE|nr:hypothetical protein [Aliarcobacter faecis]QKF72480.1 hypothetical protein AFAEC_0261 [Aliarcobacter faecis]